MCVKPFENVRDQPDASDRRLSPTVSIVTGQQTHKIKAGLCGQTDHQLQAWRGKEMVLLQVWGHSLNHIVTGSMAVVPPGDCDCPVGVAGFKGPASRLSGYCSTENKSLN